MATSGFSPVRHTLVAGASTDVVTVPFEFEITVHGGSIAHETISPIQVAQWFSAWSYWWSLFAFDVASPEEGPYPNRGQRVFGSPVPFLGRTPASAELGVWDLALLNPLDVAGVRELRPYAARPWQQASKGFQVFNFPPESPLVERLRRPGPDDSFWYELAAHGGRVNRGPEIFCVGIPWDRWARSEKSGIAILEHVVLEVGFDSCVVWVGSGESRGQGFFRSKLGPVLLATLMSVGAPPVAGPAVEPHVEQFIREREVRSNIGTIYGAPCEVRGFVKADLTSIRAASEDGLQRDDRQGICLHQTAMKLLGINPGEIDGIVGKDTEAGWAVLEQRLGLEGVDRFSPAYSKVVIDALHGKRPR